MGLSDRHYYREGPGAFQAGSRVRPPMQGLSVNTWLIIINTAVFLAQALQIAPHVSGAKVLAVFKMHSVDILTWYGHFSTAEAFFYKANNVVYLNLEVWRLLTFQFLHANFLHLFFNMFGLYIFGGMVEQYLGRRRYLAFYLLCGICGGLAYVILNLLGQAGLSFPGVLPNDPRTPLVGASAGVFGVIMACAYLAPNAMIMLLFPPIPLPLKVFAYAYVGVAALNLLMGGANAGGDAAHLGGAIAGAYFIRNSHLLHGFFDFLGSKAPGRRGTGRSRGSWPPRGGASSSPSQEEIDRILAKVATQGLGSLTRREKELLRRETETRRQER